MSPYILVGLITAGVVGSTVGGTTWWITHKIDTGTLATQKAAYEQQIFDTAQATTKAALAAQEKAAADIQTAHDQASSDVQTAILRTTTAQQEASDVQIQTAQAPQASKVCASPDKLPVALTNAVDRLFNTQASGGGNPGPSGSQTGGPAGVSNLSILAGGIRPVITIQKAR